MKKFLILLLISSLFMTWCTKNEKNTWQEDIINNNTNVSEEEGYIDRDSSGVFVSDELEQSLPDTSENTSTENPFNF